MELLKSQYGPTVGTWPIIAPIIEPEAPDLSSMPIPECVYLSREMKWTNSLDEIVRESTTYISLVYAYRGCARAVQNVELADDIKVQYYKKVVEVATPEMDKIRKFVEFQEKAINTFNSVIRDIAAYSGANAPSEEFLMTLGRVLDTFLVIDSLKNIKSSLNNDFTLIYRRARSIIKDLTDEDEKNQHLFLFLANKDNIYTKLKPILSLCNNSEDILWQCAVLMSERLENKLYASPKEYFVMKRATGYIMLLLDPYMTNKILGQKKWKPEKLMKNIYGVVPLYGDLALDIKNLLSRCSVFKWNESVQTPKTNAIRAFTREVIEPLRKEYTSLFCRIQRLEKDYVVDDLLDTQCKEIYQVLEDGVKLLSRLVITVLEQNALKYANPTNSKINPQCPETALNYEQAIRYNYTAPDRISMLELLGLITELSAKLTRIELSWCMIIRKHGICTMQEFQEKVISKIDKSIKKKSSTTQSLQQLWQLGYSKSQKYIVCSLLESVLEKQTTSFLKREPDPIFAEIVEFLKFEYWFPYMLDYNTTIHSASDVGELWYKEFYLELSKEIQFPIETSLPWILINQAIESAATLDLDLCLFSPFKIYNDAATRALTQMKMQFIYDEIEAEANLALDLFLFKYANVVFRTFKCRAASSLLPDSFKQNKIDHHSCMHHDVLKNIKTIQVLGREIPFLTCISQLTNIAFRNSFEVILSRLEPSEVSSVVEFLELLNVLRTTHIDLSEYLYLDDFNFIINEIDNGRMMEYFRVQFTTTMCEGFVYNGTTDRFTRSQGYARKIEKKKTKKPANLFGTKALGLTYAQMLAPYMAFVFFEHFTAVAKILGPQTPKLCILMLEKVKQHVSDVSPMQELIDVVSPNAEFKENETLETFNNLFKTVKPSVITGAVKWMQILGNLFLNLFHLESAIQTVDSCNVHFRLLAIQELKVSTFTSEPNSSLKEYFKICLQMPKLELGKTIQFIVYSICEKRFVTESHPCRKIFGDSFAVTAALLFFIFKQPNIDPAQGLKEASLHEFYRGLIQSKIDVFSNY